MHVAVEAMHVLAECEARTICAAAVRGVQVYGLIFGVTANRLNPVRQSSQPGSAIVSTWFGTEGWFRGAAGASDGSSDGSGDRRSGKRQTVTRAGARGRVPRRHRRQRR